MRFLLAALIFLVGAAGPVRAESQIACPELSAAKRVGTCPDATEMRRYWEETCVRQFQESNNPNVPECARYESFAELKDVALWEVEASGRLFSGYLACGEKGRKIVGSKPVQVGLECSSKTCNLYCTYQNGFSMALRDAGQCRLPGKDRPVMGRSNVDCGGEGKPCQARCD